MTKETLLDVPGTGVTRNEWLSGYKGNQTAFMFLLGCMHVFHQGVGMCFYFLCFFCPRHDWSIVKFHIHDITSEECLADANVFCPFQCHFPKNTLQRILPPGCEKVRQFMFWARSTLMGWFLQINVRCSSWSPHFYWRHRGPEKSWQIYRWPVLIPSVRLPSLEIGQNPRPETLLFQTLNFVRRKCC